MIFPGGARYQGLVPGDPELQFGDAVEAINRKDDLGISRTDGRAAEALRDTGGPLAQGIADLTVACGDRGLHERPPARRRAGSVMICIRCASVSRAAASQVSPSAKCRPAAPSRSTSAGSLASSTIRAARAPTSPCGTRYPLCPWRTESRSPGLSEATLGVPHAAASTTVIPHPSLGEGNMFAHVERNSRSFSASLTNP